MEHRQMPFLAPFHEHGCHPHFHPMHQPPSPHRVCADLGTGDITVTGGSAAAEPLIVNSIPHQDGWIMDTAFSEIKEAFLAGIQIIVTHGASVQTNPYGDMYYAVVGVTVNEDDDFYTVMLADGMEYTCYSDDERPAIMGG